MAEPSFSIVSRRPLGEKKHARGETTTGPLILFRNGLEVKQVQEVSSSQAFFSGISSAPFQGNIRDLKTGQVVSVRSPQGQILLDAHRAGLFASLLEQPKQVTGAGVSFVDKPPAVIKPTGTQVGTRTRGGVTFAVVSQGPGKPATLIEQTAFLQQREFETARELSTRAAALGQQAIEQASLRKQLAVRSAELERLSKSMVVPPAFFNKKLREFEALGGRFETGQEVRETLVGGFRSGEAKFEKTQAQLAGIAEAERITGIIQKRELEGTPLEEQFGLEAADVTIISEKIATKERARILSGKIVGLPGQFALEKQTLRDIQKKAGFSTEGELGFLGITEGERKAFPIVTESFAAKQRPGKTRIKRLAESGGLGLIMASVETGGLIARKGISETLDVFAPGKKGSEGIALLPKEFTPGISAIRGVFGFETLPEGEQFSLFGGSRESVLEKGTFAGETLTEFAALQIAFGIATRRIKPSKKVLKEIKEFKLGESGTLGKGRKRLPPRAEIKAGDIPGTFEAAKTRTEKITSDISKLVKEGGFVELGKLPKVKPTIQPKNFVETVRAGIKSGSIPDLSKFVKKTPAKIVSKTPAPTFEEVFGLKGTGAIQIIKTKPGKLLSVKRGFVDLRPFETTAGLNKQAQLSFEKFIRKVTATSKPFVKVEKEIDFFKTVKFSAAESIERGSIFKEISAAQARVVKTKLAPLKPTPTIKALDIPGSAKALAVGLPLRPKGDFEELEFEAIRIRGGLIPEFEITEPILGLKTESLLGLKTEPISITSQKELLGLISGTKESLILKSQTKEIEKEQQRESQRTQELLRLNLGIVSISKSKTLQRELEREKERESAIAKILSFPGITKQRLSQRQIRVPSVTIKDVTTEKLKTKPKRFIPPKFKAEPGITKKQIDVLVRGFAVFEKRRGKFQRVGTGALPKIAALAKALRRADITAAATVKVLPTGTAVKPSKAADIKQFLKLRPRFRPGKGGTLIEKRRFRISTPGELEQITFAPRRKKAFKGLIPSFKTSKGGLSIL